MHLGSVELSFDHVSFSRLLSDGLSACHDVDKAISALRTLCTTHGDNKWDNDLRLSDIIYKHLGVYLNQK